MRLLVAGGRDWTDEGFVYRVLDRVDHRRMISALIHGGAPGVDTIAGEWAKLNGVMPEPYPVTKNEWTRLGKAAGPIRNQRMIDKGRPQGAVIFPGGRGSQDMRRKLDKAGITRFEPIPLVDLSEKEARAK